MPTTPNAEEYAAKSGTGSKKTSSASYSNPSALEMPINPKKSKALALAKELTCVTRLHHLKYNVRLHAT